MYLESTKILSRIAKGQVFMTAQIFGYIKSSSKSKSNLKNIEMGEIDNSSNLRCLFCTKILNSEGSR